MKKGFLLLFLTYLFLQTANAQTLIKKEFIEQKINTCKNVKQTGIFIAVAGSAITIIGVFLISNRQYDPGAFLIFSGPGIIVTGAIIGKVANAKMKQYQHMLPGLTLSPFISPAVNGFCLQYKF